MVSLTDCIIVAEDDTKLRVLLSSSIADVTGLDVQSVPDGAQALQRLKERPRAKLLLLDVEMPRVNGLEVLGRRGRGRT